MRKTLWTSVRILGWAAWGAGIGIVALLAIPVAILCLLPKQRGGWL